MSYSSKDGTIKITPTAGPFKDKTVTLQHFTEATFDPAHKSTAQKGNGRVAYIAEGVAEPKLSITMTSALEAGNVAEMLIDEATGQKYTCTITHVFRRTGIGSVAYRFTGAKHSAGGGYSAKDDGVTDKLEFLMTGASRSKNGGKYKRVV